MHLGISALDIIHHDQIHQCFSITLQIKMNELQKSCWARSIPLVRIYSSKNWSFTSLHFYCWSVVRIKIHWLGSLESSVSRDIILFIPLGLLWLTYPKKAMASIKLYICPLALKVRHKHSSQQISINSWNDTW